MTVDARQIRGVEIASTAKITRQRMGWRVPSQSSGTTYLVQPEEPYCSCPDFESRGQPCKHVWAVRIVQQREETRPDGTVLTETRSVQITYRQDWPAYNKAQTHEKEEFLVLLHDLSSRLQRVEPKRRGRPRIPLSDAIFAATFKVYSTLSCRRFMSDLRAAHERGHVGRVPCYNSIFNIMDADETAEALDRLIAESARPLKALESNFACDSSGFSASRFDRWFDHKHGMQRIARSWVKAHIMCGVRTNVVTALEIHGQNASDARLLPPLLDATTRLGFDVQEVSADKGYSSAANMQAISDAGARPFIAFKNNATGGKRGIWAKMFHQYSLHREEFLSRYHQRSNVETTFHMVKSKFGDSVRSKTDRAMANEVRAKILCHNICCVIQSRYEFGIDAMAA